jgi:hypothetical protein
MRIHHFGAVITFDHLFPEKESQQSRSSIGQKREDKKFMASEKNFY